MRRLSRPSSCKVRAPDFACGEHRENLLLCKDQRSEVAESIEFSRRHEKLSHSHHREVAALPPAEQKRWLEQAENPPRRRFVSVGLGRSQTCSANASLVSSTVPLAAKSQNAQPTRTEPSTSRAETGSTAASRAWRSTLACLFCAISRSRAPPALAPPDRLPNRVSARLHARGGTNHRQTPQPHPIIPGRNLPRGRRSVDSLFRSTRELAREDLRLTLLETSALP